MSKQKQRRRHASGTRLAWLALIVAVAATAGLMIWMRARERPPTVSVVSRQSGRTNPPMAAVVATNVPSIEVAQAVVVTVDLDFAGRNPSIEEALKQIDRRYEPEAGAGRTFAILDAWGETNANGKLRISMHLSMEQPGMGTLVFLRTGEAVWKSRILPAPTGPPAQKNLTILMDDSAGNSVMLDGTKGAARVLNVPIHNSASTVRDLWPDGQEREFTFIYSVCGCPVKAKARRVGETTARTTELPVMFPDDPAAMKVINSLMGWTKVPSP
jgi:hypothetical protein